MKALWRSKRVSNDLFPLGVASLDGPERLAQRLEAHGGAEEMVDERERGVVHALAMLNSVLVSSSVRACLDLQLIREKSGESPALREMVRRVVAAFGAHVQIFVGDVQGERAGRLRARQALPFHAEGQPPRIFAVVAESFAASGSPARLQSRPVQHSRPTNPKMLAVDLAFSRP